jgi:hypothetical protein
MGLVKEPTYRSAAPGDRTDESFGTGDSIVIALFLGTFLLLCLYGLFSFLARLCN